ncbi:MAG: FAD-dependent oxidoreductase [Planctomycetota bacterium]
MSDDKINVYVCTGCGIGEALDVEALKGVVNEDFGIDDVKTHAALCSEEGVAAVRTDLEAGGKAVLAACSPREMCEVFRFGSSVVARANLREGVIWTHPANDEDTQMVAEDYVRMAVTQATKSETPEPFDEEISDSILVVGGGTTGLTAALEAAATGREVFLVEKEEELGGWVAKNHKSFPSKAPWRDLEEPTTPELAERVQANERITVHTSAKIESTVGQPGQFDVKVTAPAGEASFRVGGIVQATGWKPYDAAKLDHLGYGQSPNVVTNVEFEEMVRANGGKVSRPSDGQPPRSVAFVQCAGSRDKDHLPYCSAVCCRVSLKQALYVRESDPDAKAIVLYKDLRSPAQWEDFYRRVQEDPGVFFTKAEVTRVSADNGTLEVHAENTLLGESIKVPADLVVLATGMVPNAADGEAIRKVTDANAVIKKNDSAKQVEEAQKTLEQLGHHEGTEILNLEYRQGPDLPALKYGFPDSHFICFPYESRRTAVYPAGCMRQPNDTVASAEDAAGAVLKTAQATNLLDEGYAVHPRWGDQSYPDFFLQRCTQCKRCTEECPFGTINEDEKGTPKENPTRCRRCGICLGACPERIINFKNYSIDIISSMLKSVHVPEEFDEKPRLLAFLCENDAYPALDRAALARTQISPWIRVIPVRCLGSVNIVWIADALSRGFDGILLAGCKSGEDYQCHFIRGSELMATRSSNIQEKLQQLALETERVRIDELSIDEFARLPEIINEFAEEIEEIGMNPFKGF